MEFNKTQVDDVKRKLKRGFPAGEIEQELLESGLTSEEVNCIMKEAVDTKFEIENPSYKKVSSHLKLVASIVIILGISLLSLNSNNSFGILLVAVGCVLLLPIFYELVQRTFKRKEEL